MIESLEGKRGWPRIKPPFPAVEGYLQSPTIVNNVETLSCIPHIINRGSSWFKSIGPETGPGPRLFCISGCIKNPGVYEEPMGIPLKDLIYERAGGIPDGKKLKAVFPGGSSSAILTADEAFDTLLQKDYGKFLHLMRKSWEQKKETTSAVTENSTIRTIDKNLMDNETVLAHRLCGAGNGGFFLTFSEKNTLKIPYESVKVTVTPQGVSGVII